MNIYLEVFLTGLRSTLCSMLILLESLRSLLADDTPLELLVLFPLLTGTGLSLFLNNLSLSSIEFFCDWLLLWYGLAIWVGGALGIIDNAGLVLLELLATGRTLSGGHLRAGREDPGSGMLLPPLWTIADDLKKIN